MQYSHPLPPLPQIARYMYATFHANGTVTVGDSTPEQFAAATRTGSNGSTLVDPCWLRNGFTASPGVPAAPELLVPGSSTWVRLDTLVLQAHTGMPDRNQRFTVQHINGIQTDNRVDNMKWMPKAVGAAAAPARIRNHKRARTVSSDSTDDDDDDDAVCEIPAPSAPRLQQAAAAAAAAPAADQRPMIPQRFMWAETGDATGPVFQMETLTGQIIRAYTSARAAADQLPRSGDDWNRDTIHAAILRALDCIPLQAYGFSWVTAAGLAAMYSRNYGSTAVPAVAPVAPAPAAASAVISSPLPPPPAVAAAAASIPHKPTALRLNTLAHPVYTFQRAQYTSASI